MNRGSVGNLSPTVLTPSSGIPHSASFQSRSRIDSTTVTPTGTWRRSHARRGTKDSNSDSFGSAAEAGAIRESKEEDVSGSDEDDSRSTLGEIGAGGRGHRRGPSEHYSAGKPTTLATSLMSLEVGADERMLPDEVGSCCSFACVLHTFDCQLPQISLRVALI